ncbi:FxsA family protein [Azospirillum doebereinerae]
MNPLLLILILPILEIVGFIQVGDWIGAGPTIGLLILSAVVGVFLVRHRGLASLTRAQTATARGEAPIGAVLDGFCEVIAGILLIVPGFLSDLVALALLIRPLRRGMGRWLLARMAGKGAFQMFGTPGFGSGFGRPGTGSGAGSAPGSGPGFGAAGPRPGQPFPPPPGVIDGDYRDVSEQPAADPADTRRLEDSQWGNRRPGGSERG